MTKSGNERLTQSPTELELAADGFGEYAKQVLRQRYVDNPNPLNNLAFHDAAHSIDDVAGRVVRIIEALGGTRDEIAMGRIAAYGHDLVQNFEEDKRNLPTVKRSRFIGQNEIDSAQETIEWLKQNGINDTNVHDTIRNAIITTTTEIKSHPHTATQLHLEPKSSLVARALALADMGSFGIEGYEKLMKNAGNLFREDNLDLLGIYSRTVTDSEAAAIKERIMVWLRAQKPFAQGRRELFDKETEGLTQAQKVALLDIFKYFKAENYQDEIDKLDAEIAKKEQMDLPELLISVGYVSPGK